MTNMSYRYVLLDPQPDAAWTFDDPTPFIDWSGNSRSASSTATGKHASLVKGADYSLIVTSAARASLNSYAVMQRGREKFPFAVEAVFRSIKKDATNLSPQQVWGNDNNYDGICITGTVVSFSTKYTSTGEAKCSFDIQSNRAVHAVAIHTATKNSLYVDGELVSEVDITAAQQADTYLADGNTITAGATAGTNQLALGAIAVYREVLAEDEIDRHFAECRDNISEFHVAAGYGGSILALTDEHTAPYSVRTFTLDEDWNQGKFNGTIVEYDQVTPELRSGISIASSWSVVQPLPQGMGTLYGVTLSWQGTGVTVDTSTDGTTWQAVTKGVKTPSVPTGFDPTDKSLYIRASFAGSVANDPAYFDELVITTYLNNTLPPVDGRTVTLTNTSLESNEDIMDYDHNWGAELVSGTLTIAAPPSGSFAPKTIEVWAKKKDSSSFTDNITGATASYSNGTTLQAYQTDEWQLRTYVINAGFSGAITFTGTGQIGTVVLYPNAKTAAEVLETYRSYVGRPVITSIPTQGSIGLTELTSEIDAYDYEWSVETAG